MKTFFSLVVILSCVVDNGVQATLLRGADPSSSANNAIHHQDAGSNHDHESSDLSFVEDVIDGAHRNLGWFDSACNECETRSDCGSIPSLFQCKEFPKVGKKYCLRKGFDGTLIPNGCTCKNMGDDANAECRSGRCAGTSLISEFGVCRDKLDNGETCGESSDCKSGRCAPNYRRPSSCKD